MRMTTKMSLGNNRNSQPKLKKPLPNIYRDGFSDVEYTAVAYSNKARFLHFSPHKYQPLPKIREQTTVYLVTLDYGLV